MKNLYLFVLMLLLPLMAVAQEKYVRSFNNLDSLLYSNPNDIDTSVLVEGSQVSGDWPTKILRYYNNDNSPTNAYSIFKPFRYSGRWIVIGQASGASSDSFAVVNTIDELVNYPVNTTNFTVFVTEKLRGGTFISSTLVTTNRGTLIASTNSSFSWNRQMTDPHVYYASWFGAVSTNTSIPYSTGTNVSLIISVDSLPAINNAIESISSLGGGVCRLDAGSYRAEGSIIMRPNVDLVGASGVNSWEPFAVNPAAGGLSTRVSIYQSTPVISRNNGSGKPLVVYDYNYFTNQNFLIFTNRYGDVSRYYYGSSSVENISLYPDYVWAWNGGPPASGIYVNQVAFLKFKNVVVNGAVAPGIYMLSSLGTQLKEVVVRNCLSGGVINLLSSDNNYDECEIVGNSGWNMWLIGANTQRINSSETWNNYYDLVSFNGTTTNVVEYGRTNTYGIKRVWSCNSTNDTITASLGSGVPGIDTGMPIVFYGTDLPSPLVTNTIYYVTFVTNVTTSIKLSSSPIKSFSGITIDLLSNGVTGNWYGGVPNATVNLSDNEEVFFTDWRADQSNQYGLWSLNTKRLTFSNPQLWEMCLDQTDQRFNFLIDTNWYGAGIWLYGATDVSINGGIITGPQTYNSQGPTYRPIPFQVTGVEVINSQNVSVNGTTFDRLAYSVRSDSTSLNVINNGNAGIWSIQNTFSSGGILCPTNFYGAFFRETNLIVGAVSASKTNITGDFSIAWKGNITSGRSSYQYVPLFSLGTGNTAFTINAPYSIHAWMYNNANVQSIFVFRYAATSSDWTREQYTLTDFTNRLTEVVVQRASNVYELWLNGFKQTSTGTTSNGAGSPASTTVHGANFVLGAWYPAIYFSGWMNGASLQTRSYTLSEISDSKPWSKSALTALIWTFQGATGTTVTDISGNGVTGNVTNLDPALPILWGN